MNICCFQQLLADCFSCPAFKQYIVLEVVQSKPGKCPKCGINLDSRQGSSSCSWMYLESILCSYFSFLMLMTCTLFCLGKSCC
jgi:hypothetical protein